MSAGAAPADAEDLRARAADVARSADDARARSGAGSGETVRSPDDARVQTDEAVRAADDGLARAARMSLDDGLAIAARGRGLMFVAWPAPIVASSALLAAWPADAPAVAWSSGDLALVGLGVACELRGHGDARWRELVAGVARLEIGRAVVGGATCAASALGTARPRFIGGAAFAPGAADAPPWIGFGDAWFALPRWTYVRDGARASLVLAVAAGDARDARWAAEHARLRAALEDPPHPRAAATVRGLDRGDTADWCTRVTAITDAIARGQLAKVVAARRCVVTLDADARAADVLAALDGERAPADRRASAGHADPVRVLVRPPGAGALVAATPERLVRRDGAEVACDALAGTIARDDRDARLESHALDHSRDRALDRARERALQTSEKDRREHDLVVDAIASALAGLGADVTVPREPSVRELRHMLHLHTPIRARLREPRHLLELAERLHPTPAVGGTPTPDAVAWIAAREAPRGWYASPVGWFDLDGNGEPAVAIRSGVLDGPRVHVWAGAGIVAGSEPERELAETEVKLRAMLGALGVPAGAST